MEKKNIINPFAQKGRIITGDAFIGRFENLRAVASNVTDQAMPNNLAIIGYPRIGKSSLAKQAIIEQKASLIKDKKIPIWIDFSKFSSRDAFFKNVVRYSFDELKKLAVLLDAQTYVSDVLQQENWDDLTYYIEKYFEYTISEGYYFIFILDEFDEARSIFKGNAEAFKMLRELAYDSNKFGVAWVTTSRRSIKEIEVKSDCSSSNFNLIMTKEYLSCYDDEELQAYFQLYENIEIQLKDAQKSKIVYYCGEHPFLLASLGFEIVEKFRHNEPIEDIDNVFGKIRISILDYYEQLIDLLKEDKTFEKMLQILFGSAELRYSKDEIDELEMYSLVKKGKIYYEAFSLHFQEYLEFHHKGDLIGVLLWDLISKTEKQLRQFIFEGMRGIYGTNWIDSTTTNSNTQKKIAGLKKQKEKDTDRYGLMAASVSILEHTYWKDLFEIIINEWETVFSIKFGGDKIYWETRSKFLNKVRNPLAHQNPEFLTDSDRKRAEIYCKEILEKISLPI